MITLEKFIAAHAPKPVHFKLTRDLTVTSYRWECGASPYVDGKEVTLKAGTLIERNAFSNFGNGWSMQVVTKRNTNRWFRCPFNAMELVNAES